MRTHERIAAEARVWYSRLRFVLWWIPYGGKAAHWWWRLKRWLKGWGRCRWCGRPVNDLTDVGSLDWRTGDEQIQECAECRKTVKGAIR